jgi:hypothetical protein
MQEYGLLGCNVVYFGEIPTFRSNISPPSLGSKNKPNQKLREAGDKLNFSEIYSVIPRYTNPFHRCEGNIVIVNPILLHRVVKIIGIQSYIILDHHNPILLIMIY